MSKEQPDSHGAIIVSTPDQMKQFLEFPYQHYTGDKNWIPPLRLMQKHTLDVAKNPFYQHAEAAFFLAKYNGQPSGRIAAIHNKAYNEYNGTNTGFFGFFESIDNQATADFLLKIAGDWLKKRGISDVIGPMNPGMLDEIGILVNGFDLKPSIMMPYTKPYYDKLIKRAGYEKAMDLYTYKVTQQSVAIDRIQRAEEIVKKRVPGITIRQVNLRYLEREVDIIHKVYNKAWARNWGFSEISYDEFRDLAEGLKKIIDPDIAHVAEIDGEPVGFSISLPDINQALQHMDGSLLPFGIFKYLYYKRQINRIRTALMGVIPEYQKKGIEALLYGQAVRKGLAKGYNEAEIGWLLESNQDMIRVAEKVGGTLQKTYRLYHNDIS